MGKSVLLMNGPNINLLGTRQPEIYGHDTLADVERNAVTLGVELGLTVTCFQSNAEHELIDTIQAARGQHQAIIINPAAYSHTSVALLDALTAFEGPVTEVHISNIHTRESFRHFSYVSRRAEAVIAGCGVQGYEFALRRTASLLNG